MTPKTRFGTRSLTRAAIGLVLLALAACASDPAPTPEVVWIGGDPAHLAADKAECAKEASSLDPNVSATYSDPRYGVTSAMAAAVGRDNPLDNRAQVVRDATIATCMTGKGWKAQ